MSTTEAAKSISLGLREGSAKPEGCRLADALSFFRCRPHFRERTCSRHFSGIMYTFVHFPVEMKVLLFSMILLNKNLLIVKSPMITAKMYIFVQCYQKRFPVEPTSISCGECT